LATDKPGSKGSNEDAVRGHLLNSALEILGLAWSPGVNYLGTKPDYALYQNRATFEKAQSLINEGKEFDALKISCAIVEAERWGKEFSEKPAKSDLSDPIFQIEFYLGNARRSGGPRWGILTNDHTWRPSAIMRASPSTSRQLAYEAALIQLFRLLFILKAEADGLLRSRSLSGQMAERIVDRNGDSVGGGYWDGMDGTATVAKRKRMCYTLEMSYDRELIFLSNAGRIPGGSQGRGGDDRFCSSKVRPHAFPP